MGSEMCIRDRYYVNNTFDFGGGLLCEPSFVKYDYNGQEIIAVLPSFCIADLPVMYYDCAGTLICSGPSLLPGTCTDEFFAALTNPLPIPTPTTQNTNGTVNVGSNVTYAITVNNEGDFMATGVQIFDLLPSQVSYVSSSSSTGTYSPATGAWNLSLIHI